MKDLILVFDCITSGLTARVFRADGTVLADSFRPLTLSLRGNHAQQDPEEWWNALCLTAQELFSKETSFRPEQIAAISFSTQSQVCLCLDKNGIPLYPAITWSDTRSEEAENPIKEIPDEIHYQLTGLPDEPSSTIRKLIWLKEKHPRLYKRTHYVLQCKDYLAYRLTGRICTDYTDGSSTHALDIHTMSWSKDILAVSGISEELFPPLLHSNSIVGSVTGHAAALVGLCPGTPVVIGAGDVLCAAMGAGCVSDGDVYLSLGSSSWMAQCRTEPFNGYPQVINNPHGVPGSFLCFAPMQEAGVTFKWLKNEFLRYGADSPCPVEPFRNLYPYTNMADMAQGSCPGANGLMFLPYLLGKDRLESKGAVLGLTWQHTQADLVQAAMESICYEWKKIWTGFTSDRTVSKLVVTGPASQEESWLQMLANVLNTAVCNTTLTTTPDTIGAAILAGQAVGLYDDFDQSHRFYEIKHTFYPQPELKEFYHKQYQIYHSLCISCLVPPAD